MAHALISDAPGTPIDRYGGAPSSVRDDGQMVIPVRTGSVRNPTADWPAVDEVVIADANPAGEFKRDIAQMTALLSGLPVDVTGTTINRSCAGVLDAGTLDAPDLWAGDFDLTIAGGVESTSRTAFSVPKFAHGAANTPETADNVAKKCGNCP